MEHWALATVIATTAAAFTIVFLYIRKTRRIMDSLDAMLDSALEGDFSEIVFDESLLSAVEAKMARFLSASTMSLKNLTAEKDKIKSLISDISHQTKTSIANILLYSQLLSEYELPEDCALCVNALSAQAAKLDFLIGALIKTSRLETGIITINPQRGLIQTLLDDVISQIRSKAQAKDISIVMETTKGAAYYDPKWTAEAVYNVLDNAVKYSPRQSVITISALPYELFYRIDISDQGIGISEEEQSKIFLRFYRSPVVNDQTGVGIGLFLTREILANGGGYIKVASQKQRGSTFSIFLPTERR